MPFATKDTFTFDFTAQSDYPAWTPLQTKQNLNARSEELRLALNTVVNLLNSVTGGATGADNIGATAPTGLTGTNIQAILNSLKSAIDGVAVGAIPDGSLTDAKFSPANIKTIPYALTTNVGNAYSVTVPGATLIDGLPLCVKFNAASTGAITVNLNGLGAISVVDYFGQAVTNVRLNLIANLRYDSVNGNFQLQGKGGGGNALAGDVRLSKTATTDAGPITGSLDLSLLVTGNLRAGVTIDGVAGKASVVDTADANAIASQILSGLYAYVNGVKLTGTMPNKSGNVGAPYALYQDVTPGLQVYPPTGYYPQGAAYVAVNDANYIPGNILSGKTIFGLAGTALSANITIPLVAGDFYVTPLSSGSTSSTTYVKLTEFKVLYSGMVRVFWHFYGDDSGAAYARVYKNGVALGPEHFTGFTSMYLTEDYSVNANDLIQIYGKDPNGYTCVVYMNLGVGGSLGSDPGVATKTL